MDKLLDFIIANTGWIIAVIAFFVPPIREFVIKKFQLSLDKALEDKKSLNDRKNYISKARFDKEFELYQILSEKQISLVYDCGEVVILTRGKYRNISDCEKDFVKFLDDYNEADICLKRYAPFISQEIFEKYRELDKLSIYLLKLSYVRFDSRNCTGFIFHNIEYTMESSKEKIETMQKEISTLSDEITEFVREYLNSLDVLENSGGTLRWTN